MDIGKTCGCPPTTRCTPEQVAPNAEEAADHGCKIQSLRPGQSSTKQLAPGTSD
jgi:hypothetical protein